VQADILITGNREMLLLDVTPLSLGIETMGGVTSKIIMRNSTIPATGSEMFTTAVDNQTAVDIHVLQGERELVADNRSLARFKLRGIPPMPAGLPRVQVQFQIDANGILSVTASELRTEIEQTIEVKPSYGLTDEQVERMLLDSFEHAEADFAARLLIEARNEAENVIQATEKSLRAPDFAEIEQTELAAGERKRIESVARRPEDGAEFVRSRDHPEVDAGAERRHQAPGRGDDEPIRQGGLVRQEIDTCRHETVNAQSHLHHRRRRDSRRVRARPGAVLTPRQARVVPRPRQALSRAARARLRRQLRRARPATSSSRKARSTSARCRTTRRIVSTPRGG
jgi:hypothetical protein